MLTNRFDLLVGKVGTFSQVTVLQQGYLSCSKYRIAIIL
jgi:hypothetical protein